jgi:pimeloyl-ACP methyl ester carboxylesterase
MKTTHVVEVDGATLAAELRVCDRAQAEPVVLLHAGVTDSRVWEAQVAAIASTHTVVRYDRRGFGATRIHRPVPHSHVEDLCAVLDRLGVRRATLVGCSQGGRIALDFALAAPHRVASLLLVAPAVSGAPTSLDEGAAARCIDAIEAAEARDDIEAVNELEAQLWLDGPDASPGRVGGAARRLFLDMNGTALRSPTPGDDIEPPSAWARLDQVRCPVWVLWGDQDLPDLQQRCEALVDCIDGARGVCLPGLAHLPMLEAPDRFNVALQEFLALGGGPEPGASAPVVPA